MWTENLKFDPFELLTNSGDPALTCFVKHDLEDDLTVDLRDLWELPEAKKILKQQREDGAWVYKGNRSGDAYGENYELLETWRKMNLLIDCYGFNNAHPAIEKAAEFIFSCQTEEGDIRGILSNQYTPYYMGVMMASLIKAGYGDDDRIVKGFQWLDSMQQQDGGWIIPMTMFKMKEYKNLCQKEPIPPEKDLPFSHMATGMVIRAYAVHDVYRKSETAQHAANLLKKRMFKKDTFTSRQAEAYWYKFRYPFWWTDLLTVMDTLMRLDIPNEDTYVQKGLTWFIEHQEHGGGWRSAYDRKKDRPVDLWVSYAICRMLKRYLS